MASACLRYRQPVCWQARRLVYRIFGSEGRESREETLPDGECDSSRSGGMDRLEAILFLAREPLGSRKLAQLAGLADGTKARTLVRALNRRYDGDGNAFRVEEVAGGFQLMTRAKFAPWLRRLHAAAVEVRLSAPALETLAVVAYRQPVLRAEIEAIRGVQCGEILRQLTERDLVRIVGRSEELGRPLLYGTTRQFLQVFGLRHLDDLPRPDFLPISKRVTEDTGEAIADSQNDIPSLQHSRDLLEENPMTTLLTSNVLEELETPGLAPVILMEEEPRPCLVADAEDDDLDDDEDDEDEDDEEEDEPWEEVEDEDDEDEDWDDEDDWDDDEDDDDDWDDDDWDDDDEEEEEDDEE